MNNCELARTTCFDSMTVFGKDKENAQAHTAAEIRNAKPTTGGTMTKPHGT